MTISTLIPIDEQNITNSTDEVQELQPHITGFGSIKISGGPQKINELVNLEITPVDEKIKQIEQRIDELGTELNRYGEQPPEAVTAAMEMLHSNELGELKMSRWAVQHIKFADAFLANLEVLSGSMTETEPRIFISSDEEAGGYQITAKLGGENYRAIATVMGFKHQGQEDHDIFVHYHPSSQESRYSGIPSFHLSYKVNSFDRPDGTNYESESFEISFGDGDDRKGFNLFYKSSDGFTLPPITPDTLPEFLHSNIKQRILNGDKVDIQATIEDTIKHLQMEGKAPVIKFVGDTREL